MKLDLTWLTVYIEVVTETLRSTESALEMKRYMIVYHNKTLMYAYCTITVFYYLYFDMLMMFIYL